MLSTFRFSEKQICITGLAVFLITAFFSLGYHHFDEHFQILELASLKLGSASVSDMPWEYGTQMRSAVQPAFVVLLHKAFASIGWENPFYISTFLRTLSALCAFTSILLLIKAFREEVIKESFTKWLLPLSFFLWFSVYNAVRFSSENWSTIFFVMGFCLALRHTSITKYFAVGLLFGLSFLLRFQMGFMIAGFFLWLLLIRKEKILSLSGLTLAIIIAVGAGVFVDHWFYGEWTLSCWNYFEQNLLLGKAAGFGVQPWWWYISEVFLQALPPFSLLYLAGVFLFFYLQPKHVLTFTLVPFLLIHFAVAHKEIRFLFPLNYFLPVILTIVIEQTNAKWGFLSKQNFVWRWFVRGFWLSNLALLSIVMFRPAENTIGLYQTIYNKYPQPTTLVYTEKNPYLRVLDVHWYKRQNLNIKKVDSAADMELPLNTSVLFVTDNLVEAEKIKQPHQLIYSGLPEWLKQFNYNDWQKRTRFWYVYELK